MLGAAAALAGGLALFNFVIDPYNRFGNNRLGVYISAEREAKATEIRRCAPDALLVGNSRMAAIPPREVRGCRLFNGAFSGAAPEEIYWFLRHFGNRAKLVILGIDLGMRDGPPKGDIFSPGDAGAILQNLLSFQTAEYSFRTIQKHLAGEPAQVGPDGLLDIQWWWDHVNREDPAHLRAELERMRGRYCAFVCPPPERLSTYQKIARLLREQGTPCVVLIPPVHEAVAAAIQTSPARAEYEKWKQAIRDIFPQVIDLAFSHYGAAKNFYDGDPGHFKPEVGAEMLNEEVLKRIHPGSERLAGAEAPRS